MAFADSIQQLPYAPRAQAARGFVPPMLRAMGHILFLTACLADENVAVTDEEALTELRHAAEHWNARTETDAVSTATNQSSALIGVTIGEAITEYEGWDEAHRVQNLRDLANRIMGYTATLDRELVGITESDPGSSL